MKAIVTFRNKDGSYDSVGMNNRILVGPYSRKSTIQARAREWAHGRAHRIEYFWGDDLLAANHFETEYVPGIPQSSHA